MGARAARPSGHLPDGRQRPAGGAHPRHAQLLAPLGARRAAAGRHPHRDRTGSHRPRRLGHAARATTRSARTRRASATCCRCSACSGRRSSATRSAAAWRCSSSTSSPSAPNVWCSSPAAGSAARSARCCARPRCPASRRAVGGRAPLGRCPALSRVADRLTRRGLRQRRRRAGDRPRVAAVAGSRSPARRSCRRLRAVIDPRGQRVSAVDRLYLLESMPTLIVWGERDRTIPIAHGLAAHAAFPTSRFATLPARGALPPSRGPRRAGSRCCSTSSSTEPVEISDGDWLAPVRVERRARTGSAAGAEGWGGFRRARGLARAGFGASGGRAAQRPLAGPQAKALTVRIKSVLYISPGTAKTSGSFERVGCGRRGGVVGNRS